MKDITTKEKNCLTTREVPVERILKKGENMQIHDAAMQVLIGLFVIVLLINIFTIYLETRTTSENYR
jgi:hypothetical protein